MRILAYPDTSFLCALYRIQDNSARAIHHLSGMQEPLHVASPLLYELRQSTRWHTWLHSKDRSKGFDRKVAHSMLNDIQVTITKGAVVVIPVDWAEVVGIAERLSAQYTWTEGHRPFDILHVATALHLAAKEFLTFDSRQKKLAEAEGLTVPL